MKAIMVDGPHHGTTIHLEQEPLPTLIMPGFLAMSEMMYKSAKNHMDIMYASHHKYVYRGATHHARTAIYEYDGQA